LDLGGKFLEDKEGMTVPFYEGSQVMHVVGSHDAAAGSRMRGVFQVTDSIEGKINDGWTRLRVADVGDVL
jgi:hypothetical protein